jgi:hypothetical protein
MPTLDQPWTQADYEASYQAYGEPQAPGFGSVLAPASGGRELIQLHYHRYSQIPKFFLRWTNLRLLLNLGPGDRVCIIGCGFGWGGEALKGVHPGIQVVGTELSDYIDQEKGLPETAEIRTCIGKTGLNPDTGEGAAILAQLDDGGPRTRGVTIAKNALDNPGKRNQLRALFTGNQVDWIVTEDLLTCMSDGVITSALSDWDALGATQGIVHLLTPRYVNNPGVGGQDPGYNWKTLNEWRTFLDAAGFPSHRLVDQLGENET